MQTPVMIPPPGERLLRFVGDRVRFGLRGAGNSPLPAGWRAMLRTNLGRAVALREEVIHSHSHRWPQPGICWRDIPMAIHRGEAALDLPLTEVGYFQAKAYTIDPQGCQYWPEGPDAGIAVHPDEYRTGNTLYCAFVRMFGNTRTAAATQPDPLAAQLEQLDKQGFTVIPPSGKLRELMQFLPHIINTLGCRILHLLPVNPTPATYARFGRFGSPYAALDLAGVDPSLTVFDRRTTGVDQFRELVYAAHCLGGRVFLDLAVNHTGWGSNLQELHPEWFLRDGRGVFVSPGAWGATWEDLVELDHRHPPLWEYLAEVFQEWCRRGVDGFRCDAGYKIPLHAWRYISARVRQEFPDTIFLLEGLGGPWEATESLVTDGGMQWAYSELFQNYTGREVATYLDYSLRQSRNAGLWVHYSETHDNDRLAKKGRLWSLMRNRLCGLTSVCGGFGFTCGVEWLAAEKVDVHQSRGLAWGNPDNLVAELGHLNQLLAQHPCFFDGVSLTRLSPLDSPVYGLRRDSATGRDCVLVLVNTDPQQTQTLALNAADLRVLGASPVDLLTGAPFPSQPTRDGRIQFILAPGACHCLAPHLAPQGLAGNAYRQARAQAAWALTAVGYVLPMEKIGPCDWAALAARVKANPRGYLGALTCLPASNLVTDVPGESVLPHAAAPMDLLRLMAESEERADYHAVICWQIGDSRRVVLEPPRHWLLVMDTVPFRAVLDRGDGRPPLHARSISVDAGHIACFPPGLEPADAAGANASLQLERYDAIGSAAVAGQIRRLSARPSADPLFQVPERLDQTAAIETSSATVLLTNGRGGMARLGVDLGHIESKYDCLLGANLHPSWPVDRHVLAKRARVWVNADGFITPLNWRNLAEFAPGPPAVWRFVANAGDDRIVEVRLTLDMLDGCNTTVMRFHRPAFASSREQGRELPDQAEVRLTVRIDIEDRNFHTETRRNGGADGHFATHSHGLRDRPGFVFSPAADRKLRVFSDAGFYHHEAEWCQGIAHPVEQTRGQVSEGDAYSPGWFDLPLSKGGVVNLVLTADPQDPDPERVARFVEHRLELNAAAVRRADLAEDDAFGRLLAVAVQAFVVRRDEGKTVIAGYPWFLDWGRDSLICARGLLAAGMLDDVRDLLVTFGRWEERGTLPNTIHGNNVSNRDTSDAPLWYGVVCEEAAAFLDQPSPGHSQTIYATKVDRHGRTVADVLRAIATGYLEGTPNGIRVDRSSALVWSPAHFTWMDTNYPAGTPREGYPIEIQVLWIRLLRQLDRLGVPPAAESWSDLAQRAEASVQGLYWLEQSGYLSDCLLARAGETAARATVDTALRSNYLLAIAFGLVEGERARKCVAAAVRYLVVPGALRTLAPLPVSPPLPIKGSDGRMLNNPKEPYWGRYEGDEDTRRKPAYHNGTAWTWTFPTFCEALARAHGFTPPAVAAARAYLRSMEGLLREGCIGQLPEIVDGDAPHKQRGCDAQAWGVTEALRVWKTLRAVAEGVPGRRD